MSKIVYEALVSMIPMLPSPAWREFRGVPAKKGLNQTTHMAMIEDPTGKLHHCFVKGCPPNWFTPLTEALGWLMAEALNLPRPEFAALVLVPLDKLRLHMPMDQHWLNYHTMLAFCASDVGGKAVSDGWKIFSRPRTERIYKKPEVAQISAFDQWVNNQDRNTTNLMVQRDGACVPIDNEFILYSLLWEGKVPFGIAHKSLLDEAAKYLKPEAYAQFRVEMAQKGKLHENAFNKVAPKLQMMVQALVRDQAAANMLWTNIYQYLSSRAKPDWLATQLGVIV